MHIMDILQNSIRAEATAITVEIEEDTTSNMISIRFSDNGAGMKPELLQQATDPFTTSRTTRRVGLGLPLLKQNAERTGGKLMIDSKPAEGTTVTALFDTGHLDCPVKGDIAGAMLLTMTANPSINITYSHCVNGAEYRLSTNEITEALGDLPLDSPAIYPLLYGMVGEGLREIKAI